MLPDLVISSFELVCDIFYAAKKYMLIDLVISSFELVCDICYAAKKYMLPDLVEECTKFLWRDLYPRWESF